MAGDAKVDLRFKDIAQDEALRQHMEKRCRGLRDEFPEINHLEMSLTQGTPEQVRAQVHVTGKDTDVAAHADAPDPRLAGDKALDKLEREMRKHHDRRIFQHRREAQKNTGKRT